MFLKLNLVKKVYRVLALVGLAIVLQSNVMAQGDVGQVQVKEVVREVETVVMQPGQTEVITSEGVVIRTEKDNQPSPTSIEIKVQQLNYAELPLRVSQALDPEFSGMAYVLDAIPLRLYRISASVHDSYNHQVTRLRIYLPAPSTNDNPYHFTGDFLPSESVPGGVCFDPTSPEPTYDCTFPSRWIIRRHQKTDNVLWTSFIYPNGNDYFLGIFNPYPSNGTSSSSTNNI